MPLAVGPFLLPTHARTLGHGGLLRDSFHIQDRPNDTKLRWWSYSVHDAAINNNHADVDDSKEASRW